LAGISPDPLVDPDVVVLLDDVEDEEDEDKHVGDIVVDWIP